MRAASLARRLLTYLLLGGLSVLFLVPFFWMVSTAFKPAGQIYLDSPVWVPRPLTTENFVRGWEQLPWLRFYRNSLLVTSVTVTGSLVSSSIAGFAFASLSGRGKDALFALLLATLILPSAVTLLPTFILFSHLRWVNTYLPLIVPPLLGNPFLIFLFRQFFRTIPPELYDSAELDGCSPLDLYLRLAAPLSGPAFATAGVLAFVGSWNDFLGPMVYLSRSELFTLSVGLSLFQGMNYTQVEYLMPMSLLALVPVLLLFILAQRYYVQGVVATGLKV